MHGGGWSSFLRHDETQDSPEVTWALIRRVATYASPYRTKIVLLVGTIFGVSLLSLVPPLLYRSLIDDALPNHNLRLINLLALGMVAIPTLNGLLGVAQRYLSSSVGEGVIYDLRNSLFVHLQRMSLRFFTHTKTGELMSRLNSDVIGAQQAVTGTLVTILSNVIAVVSTLAIMLSLEWRLTLMSMSVLPFFAFAVRHVGRTLRRLRRRAMEHNAEMNALMHETLNISGALLVKLFGRQEDEIARFADRGAKVRDIGIPASHRVPLVLHGTGPGERLWYGHSLLVGRSPGLAGSVFGGHDCSFRCVPDTTVRPAHVHDECPRRIRHLDGQL